MINQYVSNFQSLTHLHIFYKIKCALDHLQPCFCLVVHKQSCFGFFHRQATVERSVFAKKFELKNGTNKNVVTCSAWRSAIVRSTSLVKTWGSTTISVEAGNSTGTTIGKSEVEITPLKIKKFKKWSFWDFWNEVAHWLNLSMIFR